MRKLHLPRLDRNLALRIEFADGRAASDYAFAMTRLLPGVGAGTEPIAGGVAVFAAGSRASRTFALGLEGPVAEQDIDRLEDFYRQRGAPALVSICPFADASLLQVLGRRGYAITEFDHVWIRPLSRTERLTPVPGVDVRLVTEEEADCWAKTVAQGFLNQETITEDEMRLGQTTALVPRVSRFLARIEGEPVGAGALLLQDGLSTLFATSTRAHARRRGVHTALLQARIEAAAAAGCELALVVTSPGTASQRNIERIGFYLAYTRPVMKKMVQHG